MLSVQTKPTSATERAARQAESDWEKAAARAQAHSNVEKPQSTRSRIVTLRLRSDRLAETKRNRIEDRKYEMLAREIERQKKQMAARVARDQLEVKRKYQSLIKDHNENTRTFFLHPGFRYKRNGEVKVDSKYSELMSLLTRGHGLDTFRAASLEAAAVEMATLMHGRAPEEVTPRKTGTQSHRTPSKDSWSTLATEASLRASVTPLNNASRKHLDSDFEENFRRRTHAFCDRFSRKCTRTSCMACEFDLKYKPEEENDAVPLSPERMKKKSEWRHVPSGSYVESTESKTRRNMSSRSRGRSPSPSEHWINEMQRVQKTDAEVTSSATTPAAQTAVKKVAKQDEQLQISRSLPETESNAQTKNPPKLTAEARMKALLKAEAKSESKSAKKTEAKPSDKEEAPDAVSSTTSSKKGDSRTKAAKALTRLKAYVAQKPLEDDRRQTRIDEFLTKLPQKAPAVATWRNSSGQLVSWHATDENEVIMPVARPGVGLEVIRATAADEDADRDSLSPTPEPPFGRFDYGGISAFDTDGSDEFTLEDMVQPSDSARLLPDVGPPQTTAQRATAQSERERMAQRIELAQKMLGLFGSDAIAGYSNISLPIPPKTSEPSTPKTPDKKATKLSKLQGQSSLEAIPRN